MHVCTHYTRMHACVHMNIPHSEKYLQEKMFEDFADQLPFAKIFSVNIEGEVTHAIFSMQKFQF